VQNTTFYRSVSHQSYRVAMEIGLLSNVSFENTNAERLHIVIVSAMLSE